MKRFLMSVALYLIPATIFAIPAQASTDDDFLAALHSHGIVSAQGGDEMLIMAAHRICGARSKGFSEDEIVTALTPGQGVSVADVKFFVQTAEQFYCPKPGVAV